MKVQDAMRASPKSCGPGTNLAAATELLWCRACGALPVVDADGKLIGIVTDRDICVAVGTSDRRASELTAEQAMSRQVATCRPGDEIHDALHTMRTRRVRRLPVVDDEGKLVGLLCLSDLLVRARNDDGSHPDLTDEDVIHVLKAIYWVHSVCCGTGALAEVS